MAWPRAAANLIHDLQVDVGGEVPEDLPKLHVKLLYPAARHHVKNKSLFVLMQDREVVFFTLLEGEVIRGVISAFSRYDITVNLKGGLPVVLLRHSIYDLRDKQGRYYLKSFQDIHRDWQKSEYFVPSR